MRTARYVVTGGAIKQFYPEYYLQGSAVDSLELTEAQREVFKGLLKRYYEWQFHDLPRDFGSMSESELKEWLQPWFQHFFDEFMAILDPAQQMMLRQFVTAEYYHIRVRDQMRDIAAAPLPWLHDDVAMAIGLTTGQSDATKKLAGSFLEAQAKHVSERQKEFFEAWQRELFEELSTTQQAEYRNALGQDFNLPSEVAQWVKNIRAFDGPLFLLEKRRRFPLGTSRASPIEFFLLADLQLDGRYEYISLWPMLLCDEIARELALTARQSAHISDWVRERESDTPDRFAIEMVLEIDHDRILSKYALYPWKSYAGNQQFATEEEWRRANDQQLERLLDESQKARLRQMWNRLIVEFGWGEVPLTFPEWRDYLRLTSEQMANFDAINARRRPEFRKLKTKIQEELVPLIQQFQQDIENVLTPQQRQAILQLFGRWSSMQTHLR